MPTATRRSAHGVGDRDAARRHAATLRGRERCSFWSVAPEWGLDHRRRIASAPACARDWGHGERRTAGQSTNGGCDIVPHTHWDREWYSPFQTFRLRLVDLLDELLPQLEADPSYAHFLLDGQMAVVDDYLAVRPGGRGAAARAGRHRPAGDGAVVRPARRVPRVGRDARAQPPARPRASPPASAAPWTSGYLPDMFGHVAQMPQLLRLFGFEHAVVWRGVPSAIDRSGFWWSAPDGSTVRAEYLPQGYGNGALVPDDAKALVRRIGEFEEEQGDLLTGPILWMNGTDHLMPQPWLGRVVAEANDLDAGYELHICSLAEHVPRRAHRRAARRGPASCAPGARANLLMGVASNRVDVKQAAARRRAGARAAGRAAVGAVPARRRTGPARCSTRRGSRSSATAPTTRSAPARSTRCATPCCTASPRPPRSPTGLTDRALHALGATVGVDGRTPVIVNPSPRTRERRGGAAAPRRRGARRARQLVSQRPAERVLMERHRHRGGHGHGEPSSSTCGTSCRSPCDAADGTELHPRRARAGRHARHAADPPASSPSCAPSEPASTCPVRVTTPPARHRARPRRRRAGYGWQAWTGVVVAGRAPVTADERRPRQRDRHGRGRPDRRHVRRSTATAASGGSSTAATSATPTTGARPTDDVVVDTPDRGRDAGRRGRTGARPRSRSCAPTRCPPTSTDGARVGSQRGRGAHHARAARRRRPRARARRARQPRPPRPPPAGATSRSRAAPHRRVAECAFAIVERGLVGRGRAHRAGAGHLPVAPLRRRRRAHRRPRGPARVRAGRPRRRRRQRRRARAHAAALHGDALAGTDGHPPAARPGRSPRWRDRSRRTASRPRFAVHLGGRDPYAVVDDAFLPLLVTRGGGPTAPGAPTGQALSVTGAEVERRRPRGGPAARAGVQPDRRADHGHDRRAGRAGCSTCAAARCDPSRAPSSSARGRSPPSTSLTSRE